MVKLLKEWVVSIAQFLTAECLSQQVNCFADHGNRPKRLNVLGRLAEIAPGNPYTYLPAFAQLGKSAK